MNRKEKRKYKTFQQHLIPSISKKRVLKKTFSLEKIFGEGAHKLKFQTEDITHYIYLVIYKITLKSHTEVE